VPICAQWGCQQEPRADNELGRSGGALASSVPGEHPGLPLVSDLMPTWASILIALASGLGSGTFAAWLTTRNDRRERFRHRLIDAADEFAGSAAEALIRTRDAIREVRAFKDAERMKQTTELAWQQRDAVLHRGARVDLLFGPGRDVSRSANDFVHELAKVVASLTPLDAAAAERAHLKAAEALRGFNVAASVAIQEGKPPVATEQDLQRHHLALRSPG